MGIVVNFLLSQAILAPIAVGLLLIKRLGKTYSPFFLLLLLGLLTEVISFVVINRYHGGNAAIIKIYSLLECCLLIYQLYVWQNDKNYKMLFVVLGGICITCWVTESIVFNNLNTFSPYFRVFYAFVIVLLSINQINSMMFKDNLVLLKDPKFILSLGFIIFFLYQIIYEASFFVGSDKSIVANKIIVGFGYINCATNLLYAVGLFFMPDKRDEEMSLYFDELT